MKGVIYLEYIQQRIRTAGKAFVAAIRNVQNAADGVSCRRKYLHYW